MKIPFLDIAAQIRPLRTEIDAAISKVIDSTAFAGGPFVEQFESHFATYCNGSFALGVGRGTKDLQRIVPQDVDPRADVGRVLAGVVTDGDHRRAILLTGGYFVVGLALRAGIDADRGRQAALHGATGGI